MDSLFDSIEKYEKCCNCGNEIKIDNSKYYMCNKCNRLLTQAKTMIGANRFSSELTYKEIAEILDITQSRISQLHSKIITKLSVKLKLGD